MSPATVSLSQHSFLTLANLVLYAPSSCRQCWVTARHHKSFPERFLHTPATAPSSCPLLWRSPSNFQSLKAQTEFRCHPQRGSTVFISCFQNSQLSHCDREHTVLGHTKSKGSARGSELESKVWINLMGNGLWQGSPGQQPAECSGSPHPRAARLPLTQYHWSCYLSGQTKLLQMGLKTSKDGNCSSFLSTLLACWITSYYKGCQNQ